MASKRNQQTQGFPAIPSSLNAGDYEMRDPNSGNTVLLNSASSDYTPYLGLRARLSQVWINRWSVLLILILMRLLLAITGLNSDIANAKTEALSACTSVENVGSAVASLPHYLSAGMNAMAADGVTKAFNGLMEMLMLTVTGVEQIVVFYINYLTSTYMCLITMVVTGSLQVAVQMIEAVGQAMNESIKAITGDMDTAITGFQNSLNGFLSDINSAESFLSGGSKTPPTIDLSSEINKLNGITIDPTTMDKDLNNLLANLPTFKDVQNFTNGLIETPFEEVKKLLNESLSGYTFDGSVFPVAQKKQLTFCTDDPAIGNFFDKLVKILYDARTIGIVVLLILAILACIPMAYLEIRRWNSMRKRSVTVQDNAYDRVDVVYIASRPYTAEAGLWISKYFKTPKSKILARWFVAYMTSLPVLVVMALGLAGLFSCFCQWMVLRAIDKEVPVLAQEVGDFAGAVVSALTNASEEWANGANSVISSANDKVNKDVFGWVNTTTTALNDTLNAVENEINKVLNATFGGTVLMDPITQLIACLVTNKIDNIEKGLTWVQDNAHVDFPEFRKDVFSMGANASITNSSGADSFLSSPGSVTSNDITSAIVKVTNKLQEGIRQEAIISACVVFLWFIVMFMGLSRVIFLAFKHDKTRAEGGPVFTGDNRPPMSPRSPPNPYNESEFPQFGGPVSAVPRDNPEDADWGSDELVDEKSGYVAGHRSVDASIQPGYDRSSSYGYLDGKH